MEEIIEMIKTLKEDRNIHVIDRNTIEQYIQDNINLLIEEISNEVN